MFFPGPTRLALLAGALCISDCPRSAVAVSLTLTSSADSSLFEVSPTNNLGAQPWVHSGTTQNGPRTRALIKFDLTVLPTNTRVRSASVFLTVTKDSDEPAPNASYGLHRVFRPWGEGDNLATSKPGFGHGLPADPGEVTWQYCFYPTNAWTAPGGAEGPDYSSVESSFCEITGLDTYEFPFSPELLADVQDWVDHPEVNFGWLLLCNTEDVRFTARRFASREDPNEPPILELDVLVRPAITTSGQMGNQFQFSFNTWPGHTYEAQFWDGFPTNSWQTLTNLGTATNAAQIVVTDSMPTSQRFYRINAY